MRLAQLARQLGVRPSDIIEFLATRQIAVDDNSNARVEDEHVTLLIRRFGQEELIKPENEPVEPVDHSPIAVIPPSHEPEVVEEDKPEENKVELIKAQRVELSGLKVVGKIELPEARKKEAPSTDEGVRETPAEPAKQADRRSAPSKRDRGKDRQDRKNPIALQREREAQELEQRKRDKAREEKELRTKKYHSRVKGPTPTKRVKLVEEHTEVYADDLAPPPKTWLGKFVRWLTT